MKEDRVAYFDISFEFFEIALREAFGLPESSSILDVVVDHDIMFFGPSRKLRVKISDPSFLPVSEGQMLPQKTVVCQQKRWEFK